MARFLQRIPGLRGARPGEAIRLLVREFSRDRVTTMAASLAYFALLSVFPFLIFLVAVVTRLPLEEEVRRAEAMLGRTMPPEVARIIGQHLADLLRSPDRGLLSVGLLAALWSASRAVTGLITALNVAYDVSERRGWLRVQVTSMLLTVGAGGLIVVALVLLAAGDALAGLLARFGVLGELAVTAISWARWPVLVAVLLLAVECLFYFGPDVRQRWRWITPGSVLAVALWVAGGIGLRLYVAHFGNYNATYGSLGAVVILMLYFYVSALALLVGGELNAVLDHLAGERQRGAAAASAERPRPPARRPDEERPPPPR